MPSDWSPELYRQGSAAAKDIGWARQIGGLIPAAEAFALARSRSSWNSPAGSGLI
jgi:hypothetical protein